MIKIIVGSLRNRRRTVILVIIAISVTVFLFVGVQRTKELSRTSFSRTVSGTDIIFGARSGQLNLVLYSVFHMGSPIANVRYDSFLEFKNRKEVEWAIPISLGDSHHGYRVVGTTLDYFNHYTYGRGQPLGFFDGRPFRDLFDVVLGARVARDLGYHIGEQLVVSHGEGRSVLSRHDELPFTVSGILEPTGTPADRAVYISIEAITAIHVGWESGMQRRSIAAADARSRDLTPDSITAAFVGLKTPQQAFGFQRTVNTYESEALQAILPGVALFELWQLMRVAERALSGISAAVVVVGLLSLTASQLAVVEARRREMALLRSLGASPLRLAFILLAESSIVTLIGCISGLALLYFVEIAAKAPIARIGFFIELSIPSATELMMLALVFVSGSIAGVIPAASTYRQTLHDGLAVKE